MMLIQLTTNCEKLQELAAILYSQDQMDLFDLAYNFSLHKKMISDLLF